MHCRSIYIIFLCIATGLLFGLTGCKKDSYSLPTPKGNLQNDVIKRSLGPNIVGSPIEFAYAMAILPEKGKLVSASVTASIAGGTGTYLENRSFYTASNGSDVGIPVGTPSVNDGATTTVNFNVDTFAATLRYYYIVPEEARGKQVSFTFSAKSSNGETVTYSMGPYTVAKMDMKRLINVTDSSLAYISIADMAAYGPADAATKAGNIDLVYLYRNLSTSAFNHALVSPAATEYLPGVTLPPGLNKSSKLIKVFNLQDFNLAQLQYGIYIDDLDFQKLDFTNAPNYAINLKQEAGVWVETADGKYRAYIYLNTAAAPSTTKSAVISIKRYTMK